jgi:hypothetical protein
MINIGKILKRSWHILWNYKVLWLFGILLAITGAGSGNGGSSSSYQFNGNNGSNGSSGYNPNYQPGPFMSQLTDWFNQNIAPLFEYPAQHIATFVWIGVAFLLIILVIGVVTSIVRYVSENAVIRMVDQYEQSGTKVGFRQGWRLGWNRRAFRLWVIDLVISIPAFLFIALLLVLGLVAFFSARNGNTAIVAGGLITAIGCAFLFIFALIILMVLLSLLRQFFIRAAVLEEAGIGESFRRGWAMFKRNWKSAGLMWLVMLGIGIGYGIVGLVLFFLFIPAYLVLLVPGALVAAIPAAIALGITSIFASGPLAWIVAALVAIPFFFLVVFAPLSLTGGLYTIFTSNVWTLTYREMKALEAVKGDELPITTA